MRRLGTLLAGTLAALGLAAVPTSIARADTITPLPITSYYQMAVDSAHGHIFISQGSTTVSTILVTNLSGRQLATIAGQSGVKGLALSADGSTLYAALSSAHEVTAISTATLQQTAAYPLPSTDTPRDVAVQSGKVWVSYSDGSAAAIGDIDLSASPPAFHTQAAMGGWTTAPQLAADPSDTGVLVATDPASSPGPVASYKVSVDPVTVNAQSTGLTGCTGKIADAAIAAGAKELVLACGSASSQLRYNPATLAQLGTYPSGTGPDAVAIAPDGEVAAGTPANLYIYQQAGTAAVTSYSSSTLASRGLAWLADGSQLFAVTTGATFNLHVFYPPRAESLLTVKAPASSQLGKPLVISGTLTLVKAGLPTGATVTVTRTVTGAGSKQFTAPVASDGSFTVTDTPTSAVGTYTYSASYAGTTTIAPAAAATHVQVTRAVAVVALSGPTSTNYTNSITVTGSLTVTGVALPSGTTVTITRNLVTGGQTKTFTVPVSANGSFSQSDTPPVDGKFSYKASYAGTTLIAPASATHDVDVIGFTTSLTVTTGVLTFNYGQTISITAHLGTTYTNRTVSIYAQTFGSQTKTLLKTGTVNSNGALSTTYPAKYNTVFIAVFTGDAHYAPATARHSVMVRVLVTEKLSGYYSSTTINGITYRLYHQSNPLDAAATVAPNHAGECLNFEYQEELNGTWYDFHNGCVALDSASQVAVPLSLSGAAIGQPYRIRGDFVHSSSDVTNINNDSSWQYFMVEK